MDSTMRICQRHKLKSVEHILQFSWNRNMDIYKIMIFTRKDMFIFCQLFFLVEKRGEAEVSAGDRLQKQVLLLNLRDLTSLPKTRVPLMWNYSAKRSFVVFLFVWLIFTPYAFSCSLGVQFCFQISEIIQANLLTKKSTLFNCQSCPYYFLISSIS